MIRIQIKSRYRTAAAALMAVAAVTLATTASSAAGATSAAPYCGIWWGSLAKSSGIPMYSAPLTNVRVGQHTCYDRVVFDVAGRVSGYRVRYVSQVVDDASGERLDVRGGARLQVTLQAPAHDEHYHPTYPYRARDHVANVAGFRTLRDVVFDGTYEGYTTFGIGVRARLPFRVFLLPGPGAGSRIVVDFAHRW